MKGVILSPEARVDLYHILDYLTGVSDDATDRVREKLEQAMIQLAKMPGLGQPRNDLADEPLRIWPVYSYLIIYRPAEDGIEVARIVHSSRDLGAIFGNRGVEEPDA